ncbi:hypothetical protein BU24DRAFT_422221, partial [Aaosphaeria arxii CBS 175.79]
MLFTEAYGSTATADNSFIRAAPFVSEQIDTQIRRFIVVRVPPRKTYFYACPVFTYGGGATREIGVDPEEHAVVYSVGEPPQLLKGETHKTIGVIMDSSEPALPAACRIRFGIHVPVEHNVKVKNLGMVQPDDLARLVFYWQQHTI